jgi:chromate transport protein ChrA
MIAFIAGSAWIFRGWIAAIVAVAVVTVPTSVLAVIITDAYETWSKNVYAGAAISGVTSAAIGMMFAAAWLLMRSQLRGSRVFRTVALVMGSFLLSWKTPISAVQTFAIAALVGYFWPEPKAE